MKNHKGWQHFPLPPLYPLYPYVAPTDKAVAEKPVRFTIEQRGNCTVFLASRKAYDEIIGNELSDFSGSTCSTSGSTCCAMEPSAVS